MIFKRLKQLEWRVAELEIDMECLTRELDEIRYPQLTAQQESGQLTGKEKKRGRGRPKKNR